MCSKGLADYRKPTKCPVSGRSVPETPRVSVVGEKIRCGGRG